MLSDQDFREVVAREIRGNVTSAESHLLERPDMTSRWRDALVAILEDIDNQLLGSGERQKAAVDAYESGDSSSRSEVDEALARESAWRSKAQAFQRHVVSRLHEVEARIDRQRSDLATAIQRHQEATLRSEYEPSDFDLQLWSTIS